ncbi:hypothetical protein D3C73_1602610 [compost metagenome]
MFYLAYQIFKTEHAQELDPFMHFVQPINATISGVSAISVFHSSSLRDTIHYEQMNQWLVQMDSFIR